MRLEVAVTGSVLERYQLHWRKQGRVLTWLTCVCDCVQEEWEGVDDTSTDGLYDFSQTVDLLRACRECSALVRQVA